MSVEKEWKRQEDIFIPETLRKNENVQIVDCTFIQPIVKQKPKAEKISYLLHINTNNMILVKDKEFIIGKSTGSNYRILSDSAISRYHAKIYKEGELFYLEDMNSSNHIFIGDERIEGKIKIDNGTIFSLAKRENFKLVIEEV